MQLRTRLPNWYQVTHSILGWRTPLIQPLYRSNPLLGLFYLLTESSAHRTHPLLFPPLYMIGLVVNFVLLRIENRNRMVFFFSWKCAIHGLGCSLLRHSCYGRPLRWCLICPQQRYVIRCMFMLYKRVGLSAWSLHPRCVHRWLLSLNRKPSITSKEDTAKIWGRRQVSSFLTIVSWPRKFVY